MKYLTILALLGSFAVYAQSPSAIGTPIASPSGSVGPGGSGFGSPQAPVDTGSIPNTNNALNVAPTSNSNAFNVAPGTQNNSFNVSPGTLGNDLNTAPSTIPADTTLLNNTTNIPSNNPPAQAQEFDAFGNPNTTTIPGSNSGTDSSFGTGSSPGTGTSGSDFVNPASPIPSP